ncbi:hypothetical protein NGF19_14580 [Streptomyces sp. RY43-2]|uniref:Flp pilus assembly protein RcpC/CpaB domain-containing protein n=2 Tax=Streptomyces macrolidinus TaxID=2952607 RepID=A0ABT0ZEK7_9ACTN|nr:hypothetical protein [Streptomyces macrolidinus]MCN9242002.1 hypothetical protein [Streptomyces macrolidinus]
MAQLPVSVGRSGAGRSSAGPGSLSVGASARRPGWGVGVRTDTPPTCAVPRFAPVRVRGGRQRLRCLVRHRRRAVAMGLAVGAAALVAAGPRAAEGARGHPGPETGAAAAAEPARKRPPVETVTAPVRIADGATVRMLRPGDRVDVIAADGGSGSAQVVAAGARVTRVPDVAVAESGALLLLSVPRATAARLAGAGATSRLAVTLC